MTRQISTRGTFGFGYLGRRFIAAGQTSTGDVSLLTVATLTPRKGYDLLLDALTAVPHDNWRLRCAGSAGRDPATMARVRWRLHDRRLADRVELVGDMESWWGRKYDRAALENLYGGLQARPLPATLIRGKAHEQAVARSQRDLIDAMADLSRADVISSRPQAIDPRLVDRALTAIEDARRDEPRQRPESRENRAITAMKVAKETEARGSARDTKRAYRLARDIYAALVRDFPDNATARKNLAACHLNLANVE